MAAAAIQCHDKTGISSALLQEAYALARDSRRDLAEALQDVSTNLRIAQLTKKGSGWQSVLDVLHKLQQASHLHEALK